MRYKRHVKYELCLKRLTGSPQFVGQDQVKLLPLNEM